MKDEMSNDQMSEILGFEPNEAAIRLYLKMAKDQKKTLREILLKCGLPSITLVKDGEAMPPEDGRRRIILTVRKKQLNHETYRAD
ncbi:MAG TPA: hypothetical protein VMW76_09690 [Bacteroidales bacterium]|nr:hypothetical protein [Bacteroidales bacterium]